MRPPPVPAAAREEPMSAPTRIVIRRMTRVWAGRPTGSVCVCVSACSAEPVRAVPAGGLRSGWCPYGQQTQNDQQVQYGQQTTVRPAGSGPAAAYPNAPQPVPLSRFPQQPAPSAGKLPAGSLQPVPEPQGCPPPPATDGSFCSHLFRPLALPDPCGWCCIVRASFFGGLEALRIVGLVVVAVFGLWVCGGFLTTRAVPRAPVTPESNHLMARRGIVFRLDELYAVRSHPVC